MATTRKISLTSELKSILSKCVDFGTLRDGSRYIDTKSQEFARHSQKLIELIALGADPNFCVEDDGTIYCLLDLVLNSLKFLKHNCDTSIEIQAIAVAIIRNEAWKNQTPNLQPYGMNYLQAATILICSPTIVKALLDRGMSPDVSLPPGMTDKDNRPATETIFELALSIAALKNRPYAEDYKIIALHLINAGATISKSATKFDHRHIELFGNIPCHQFAKKHGLREIAALIRPKNTYQHSPLFANSSMKEDVTITDVEMANSVFGRRRP